MVDGDNVDDRDDDDDLNEGERYGDDTEAEIGDCQVGNKNIPGNWMQSFLVRQMDFFRQNQDGLGCGFQKIYSLHGQFCLPTDICDKYLTNI